MSWESYALNILQNFGGYIIPLISKSQPVSKLNPTLGRNKDLPPHKLPSKDPNIIKNWARQFPGYGVVPEHDFIIVDVDIKSGQNGKESIKFMFSNGLPSDTFTVKSPSGGLHLYYEAPKHYVPKQSVGDPGAIRFADKTVQKAWTKMQLESGCDSSGIDTRFGWGYAVGPGSRFDSDVYQLVSDNGLREIPLTMQIGSKAKVHTSKSEDERTTDHAEEEIPPGSIREGRNDHATQRTFLLATKGLPEVFAKAIIRSYVDAYDNFDGEAPTFDQMWDMYVRAKAKIDRDNDELGSGILDKLGDRLIYVTSGKRVFNTQNFETYKFDELLAEYENKLVFIDGKMHNPLRIWFKDSHRKTVKDVVYTIKHGNGIFKTDTNVPLYNLYKPPIATMAKDFEPTVLGKRMFEACVATFNNVLPYKVDRDYFLAWVAMMVLCPHNRLTWNWHIYSDVHGVGKDAMGDIITMLYGQDNVKRMNPDVFLDRTNMDLYTCGLAIMSDFTRLKKQGEVLQRYKEVTGSDKGRERRLYAEATQSFLSVRFLMLTNHESDFPVEHGDRRTYKSHCVSGRLNHEVAGLVKAFTGHQVNPKVALEYNIPVPEPEDILYCKGLLYDFFRKTDYAMLPQDCPSNHTKDESLLSSAPNYIEELQRYIEARIFVFASDIITEDSIRVMKKVLKIQTSVGTILTNLLEHKLIHKFMTPRNKACMSKGMTQKYVTLPSIEYIEDLDRLVQVGEKRPQKVFFTNPDMLKRVHSNREIIDEYELILDKPNISYGYCRRAKNHDSANK